MLSDEPDQLGNSDKLFAAGTRTQFALASQPYLSSGNRRELIPGTIPLCGNWCPVKLVLVAHIWQQAVQHYVKEVINSLELARDGRLCSNALKGLPAEGVANLGVNNAEWVTKTEVGKPGARRLFSTAGCGPIGLAGASS